MSLTPITLRSPRQGILLTFILLAASLCPPHLYARQMQTLRVESHLIDSTVSVHNADGNPISGLTKDDFTIVEDGVPQQIRFFSRENLPLSIGLLVDASDSQSRFFKEHAHAIEVFLHQILAPADQAFAVCFGNHLRLVSDLTSSPAGILEGIRSFDKGSRNFPELGPKEDRDLGTALHDAVFYSISERLTGIPQRRKVLLLFSDGEENSSGHDLLDSIEAAQDADVLVYAIRFSNLHKGRLTTRGRYGMRVLDHLSTHTGGKSFDASSTDLASDFAEIAADLRSLYSIAYQSTNPVRDGSFRKVVIQTSAPAARVRSRSGYYAR